MTTPGAPEWARSVPSTPAVHLPPNPKPSVRPLTVGQLLEIGRELINSFIARVVQAVVGFFFPNSDAFEQLQKWADDVGKGVQSVQTIIGGALHDAGAGAANFVEFLLGSVGFDGFQAAGSLFGPGQLGDVNPELMINGSFDGTASMPADGGWEWDPNVDHTGRAGSGSAKVLANGSPRCLLSNAIAIAPSNEIDASVWVKWSGRQGTGNLSLILHIYDENDNVIDAPVLAAAPAGATGDWYKLSGTYNVPNLLGGKLPAHACAGFLVDEGVTRGSIWFDDASLRKINPISHKLVAGMQKMYDDVTGTVNADVFGFIDALQSFDRIKTGTIIDDFIPGIGRLLDAGVRGLLQLPPTTEPFTHAQFLDAATTQAKSTLGNGVDIGKLWQYLNAGIYDEFERNETTLGSNWSAISVEPTAPQWGYGNGTLRTEGHNAAMQYSWPGGDSQWMTRWVGANASSMTDYQQVSIVLGSAPGLGLAGYCGHNDVLGRVGGVGDYIRFRVGGDGSWSVSKFVGGTEYRMKYGLAGSITVPGPGSMITLYCGDKASSNKWHFKAMINSATIADFDEQTGGSYGPQSGATSSYRGRGMGFRAEGVPVINVGWVGPGMVNYWASSDQP